MTTYKDMKTGKYYEANTPGDLPKGGVYEIVSGTPSGCACVQCNPGQGQMGGNVSVKQGATQVESYPTCSFPTAQPIRCEFQPCYQLLFIDCSNVIWSYDPYNGGPIYCLGAGGTWTVAKTLQQCPPLKGQIFYNPDSGLFYASKDGVMYENDPANGGWVTYNGPAPTCLYPLFRDPTDGTYHWYSPCTEEGLRNTIANSLVPWCTGLPD